MTDLSATAISASALRAQGVRLRHISENIANADTPGYRRKLVTFEEQMDFGRRTGAVEASPTRLDQREPPQVYDPANPMADENGYYDGSNVDLVVEVAQAGKLPVTLFTAGGIATPADAAMMMQLGADGVFVGSGIFKSGDPARRAAAIVKATAFYDDAAAIAQASRGLGEAMVGINVADLPAPHRLAERGW